MESGAATAVPDSRSIRPTVAISLTPEYTLLAEAIAPSAPELVQTAGWDRARWDAAVHAAAWHRLSPLLHRRLLARGGGAPADVAHALESAYMANAARNLLVGETLRTALAALEAAGVEAMPLKGAALIEHAYPEPALRELLDLDVLVPARKLDAANAALRELGFRADDGDPIDMRLNHHHDPVLVNSHGITAVELHHHVAMVEERRHFTIAGLWERARPSAAGAHLLPAPEDLLLHACLHFTRNRLGAGHRRGASEGALSQIADLAWIAGRERVDWDALARNARAYRLAARVFLPLFAARELGVAMPPDALAALRPPGFDPRLGRRLIALRVLRSRRGLPVRSLRWIVAPPRDALERGWNADPRAKRSLARAYLRRASAQAPAAAAALKRPLDLVHDYRLNGQIHALEPRD
jgi:hypothetical protein